MSTLNNPFYLALITAVVLFTVTPRLRAVDPTRSTKFRAVLLSAAQATATQLESARSEGATAVVLELKGLSAEEAESEGEAALQIQRSGLELYYWMEIGRNPSMAESHPEWMASLQGHSEWRRFFKETPLPQDNEVVKNYPWVPILYEETFDAHRTRVAQLLKGKPSAQGIFLNDLQAGPSACGCGNLLCRWTADYGPIRTATPLGDDAAAKFVAAVKEIVPGTRVIPVWTTECEEHDKDGPCAGVGCFTGLCWKAYTAQLMPVVQEAGEVAVLLPYRDFQRDAPLYGEKAGWVKHALESFTTMPPRHRGTAISTGRLIAVLQGWNVSAEEVQAQIARAEEAGAAGYIVSLAKIEQSWEPRIVKWKNP